MLSSSKRKLEPAHYMLRIESFSLLSEAISIKIESDVFEASGHKWRLDLYPNGNVEKSGGDNISLYLVICDTESLSKGWEVFVDVTFFVYNYKGHNYATFKDIDGNRTRFNESKKIWGFDKLISLESFKKIKNGYLLKDACVFGVEVFAVSEFAEKDRCLSFIKPPAASNTFTWTIDRFSNVTQKFIHSNVFKVDNVKWRLCLFPKGHNDTYLSTYLHVFDHALFPDGWRVFANFKLRVKYQSYKGHRKRGRPVPLHHVRTLSSAIFSLLIVLVAAVLYMWLILDSLLASVCITGFYLLQNLLTGSVALLLVGVYRVLCD